MASRHTTENGLAPELEAIATAAADQLRAQIDVATQREDEPRHSLADAATRAIAVGLPLGAIADAERVGQTRARDELGAEVLRRVERAGRRKREADREYHEAIARAARLGLTHRDVAAAAHIAHGTVRSIVARTGTAAVDTTPPTATMPMLDADDPGIQGTSETGAAADG